MTAVDPASYVVDALRMGDHCPVPPPIEAQAIKRTKQREHSRGFVRLNVLAIGMMVPGGCAEPPASRVQTPMLVPHGDYYYVNGYQECAPVNFNYLGEMDKYAKGSFCTRGLAERAPTEVTLTCVTSGAGVADASSTVFTLNKIDSGIMVQTTDYSFALHEAFGLCSEPG